MTPRLRPVHLALLLAFGCASAQAGDLLQAYDLARQSDPQLAGSEANKRAQEEGVPQARSLLLPQIGGTASLTKSYLHESEISTGEDANGNPVFFPLSGTADTTTRNYGVNAQQSIYDHSIYTRLKASHSRADQADAQYDNAAETLITRVAQAYFNVLSAIQDLASSRAEDRALKRQLDQANVRLQVGLAPITDAQEAQAQYDISRANTIGFETALSDAREALTEITGQPIEHFKGLAPDFTPAAPAPEDVDAWVKMAVDQNPQIRAQQLALDAANHDVDTARAGHLPTIAATVGYNDSNTWGNDAFDGFNSPATGLSKGPTYAVTLTVPIFSGFAVSSKVRQALAVRDGAADTLEQTRRSIERQARNYYHATVAGLSQIEAQKQALLSAQTSLEATETGLEVGTRTIVDVLINEQQLFSTQRDYARARNNFVVNELLLKQAAGNIQGSDVNAVNALLVSDAEAALDQPADAGDTAMPGLPTGPAAVDVGTGKPNASTKTDNAANTGTDTLVKHKKKKKHLTPTVTPVVPSTDAPATSPPSN